MSNKPTVFVFEDDHRVHLVYALALMWKARLCLFHEVESAFPRLYEADLIITDCDMPPSGGGLALLRHVRQNDIQTPVLMVTGDPTRRELSRDFPDQAVLGKPFTLLQLDAALAAIGFPGLVRHERPPAVQGRATPARPGGQGAWTFPRPG